ncbi:MAG: 5-(carboxyamino)imidazole ribonucleotide synthase [Acuticoccus sp.]
MLPIGATIGIIGGGQLGRMLSLAALDLGFRVHVFAPPEADNVAFATAHHTVAARYDDGGAMAAFAAGVDVLTYEFENVPVAALDGVATPIHPNPQALLKAQDRLTEKAFLAECGLTVGAHRPVGSVAELDVARGEIPDGFLKARRLGYDGKGQARITPDVDSEVAFAAIGSVPAILEARIPFVAETSLIMARSTRGDTRAYEMADNRHEEGILRRTAFPGPLGAAAMAQAAASVARICEALSYVGVIGVEFFATGDRAAPLVVNEMAPRVHNTGHWTMDGALTSQFHNHIRAIAGWPLGPVTRTADVTMDNLLGDEVFAVVGHLDDPAARPHIYGKRESRAGRKMGHINFVGNPVDFGANRC